MTGADVQALYEDLRDGGSQTSGHGLAVLIRSGLAAWMALLSARRGNAARSGSNGRTRAPPPAAHQEVVQVLAAMVIGNLQGANP